MKQGYDVVLVGRMRAVSASYQELERAFLRVCEKLSLLENNP